ncbi:hypothetical protein GTV32_17685 [Gordonia sp. SID5947]|nr:hypothetical protein [Gordonia sp. SID5947]
MHFGLSHLFKGKAPDLVVSGANHGINTGGAANNSGTVNAAIEALEQGVPAIAISTEDPAECDPETTAPPLDFTETASYTSELVAAIASHRDGEGPLLPAGVGLNVTYPAGKAKGTKLTAADVDPAQVDYVETTPGQFEAVPSCAGTADDPATDFGAMRAGYVAITQLEAPQKQGGVADDLDYLAELK